MPLIKDRREVDDIWAYVPDDAPLSPGGCITVSLGRFRSETELLLSRNTEIGVRLEPADDPHELEEHLSRLALIEISFPKYTDGRGYSQAQLLRRRLGYEGELRADTPRSTDEMAPEETPIRGIIIVATTVYRIPVNTEEDISFLEAAFRRSASG